MLSHPLPPPLPSLISSAYVSHHNDVVLPAAPRRPDQHEESHPDGAVSVPMYRRIDMSQADFAKVGGSRA